MLDTVVIMISRRLITSLNYSTRLLYKEMKTSRLQNPTKTYAQ